MKKQFFILLASTLLFSCSKKGPSTPPTPTTKSKIVHYMRIKHNGKILYAADTAYYSYTGVIVPPTLVSGNVISSSNNQVFIKVSAPKMSLGFVGNRIAGTVLGEYIIHDGVYDFRYTDASGDMYAKYLIQDDRQTSKLNIIQVDDSNIIGTARVLLNDSSIAELEFNAKPSY